MSLERRYLLNREVQSSDSATRIVQLPRAGNLSAIGLRVEITNGATSGTERVWEAIDRVEVIANGSEVLFSLEGRELEKWMYVWSRRRAPQVLTQVGSAVQEIVAFIPFGRFIGDPELYLPLERFQTVELRVQYSPTISATTFATGTTTISAILYMWRQGAVGLRTRGYIRTTQFRSFTSAASGEDVTELPRRFPLLDILVFAREAGVADGTDITQVEVREDDGLVIPYTGRWLDIQAENHIQLDLDAEEAGIAVQSDNDTIDTRVSRIIEADVKLVQDLAAGADFTLVNIASITGDRLTLHMFLVEGSSTYAATILQTTDQTVHWKARGIGIGNAVYVPLWDRENLETAYPAPSKSKVSLALTQGGDGADVRCSVRELVAT